MTELCDECDGSGHKRGSGWEGERTELGAPSRDVGWLERLEAFTEAAIEAERAAVPPVPEAPERPEWIALVNRSGEIVKPDWWASDTTAVVRRPSARFGYEESWFYAGDWVPAAEPVAPVQDEPAPSYDDRIADAATWAAHRVVAAFYAIEPLSRPHELLASMADLSDLLGGLAAPEPLAVQDEGRDEAATVWAVGDRFTIDPDLSDVYAVDAGVVERVDAAEYGVHFRDALGSYRWIAFESMQPAEPVPVPVAPPAACADPECRDGWIFVDIDERHYVKQRCPSPHPEMER
jgi:hypothetical protein